MVPNEAKVTQNAPRLVPHQVLELMFQPGGEAADPTWDVTIDVMFASPAGKAVQVGGFFDGSSKPRKPVVHEHTDGRGRRRDRGARTGPLPGAGGMMAGPDKEKP